MDPYSSASGRQRRRPPTTPPSTNMTTPISTRTQRTFSNLSRTSSSMGDIPRSPAFAQQISLAEYDKQSKDYTERMLKDLANSIRKQPNLVQKAPHFAVKLLPTRKKEKWIEFLLAAAIAGFVFLMILVPLDKTCQKEEENYLNVKFPAELCSIPIANALHSNTFWESPKMIALVGFITLFILWIGSMTLESMQLRLNTTGKLLGLKVFINYILPFFGFFFLCIISLSILFGITFVEEHCKTNAVSFLEDFIRGTAFNEIFMGIVNLLIKFSNIFMITNMANVSVTFSLLIFIIFTFIKNVSNSIIRPANWSIVFLWLLSIFFLGVIVPPNDLYTDTSRKGEWMIFVICVIQSIKILLELWSINKETNKYKLLDAEPLPYEDMISLDEENDDEDEDQ